MPPAEMAEAFRRSPVGQAAAAELADLPQRTPEGDSPLHAHIPLPSNIRSCPVHCIKAACLHIVSSCRLTGW